MSKTIRVSDETYKSLDELLERRETFNQALVRLIDVFRTLKDVSDALGPGHYLKSKTPPGGNSEEGTQR